MEHYCTEYRDARGCENTDITNDSETLWMAIRGLTFSGTDFDSFEPTGGATPQQLEEFSLNRNRLCSCRIECQISIPISDHGRQSPGMLFVDLALGDSIADGRIDREELRIVLEYNRERFAGSGRSGWFEDELIDIQRQLPDGIFMQACINCLYSDYSPYGHGLFGCMMCFRNIKTEYQQVKTKDEFWHVHDRYDRMVQETYLCPEFERRIPGTGYRG
jgi:hypothetical protein